ncbi:hypothetical protein CDD83_1284 [Cordyceps sp. RAO-2017]|nr:hypothetical protein CDD83_1284 [Cordyceps sp. RAO-2017]
MPPRWSAALRRATGASLGVARSRTAVQPFPSQRRAISILPWRRNRTPVQPLPVYFASPKTSRPVNWKGPLGRLVFAILAYWVCWEVFSAVVLDPLLDWGEDEWDNLSEKEKEEWGEMADEDGKPYWFLPIPFTTTAVSGPPYKPSDPEWATFVALNKDPKLQREIKETLADIIGRSLQREPSFIRLSGGNQVKLRKLWLDILYPSRPPPKHFIAGIAVLDEGIFLAAKQVDTLSARRLDSALSPTAVALTAWTFVSMLYKQAAVDMMKAVGLGPAAASEQGGPPNAPAPRPKMTTRGIVERVTGASAPDAPADGQVRLDPRVEAASVAAAHTFAKNWRPPKQPPNRGCVRVDGILEYQGKTAILCFYVFAWYDPKLKHFMGIELKLKHISSYGGGRKIGGGGGGRGGGGPW